MRTEERISRRLYVVASHEPSALDSARLRSLDEVKPIPSWPDLLVVFGVCVPLWAGLTLLISAWP
jgi:hypothetical protein